VNRNIKNSMKSAVFPKIDPVEEKCKRPTWSIMIPAFNRLDYLKIALESVLRQDKGIDQMQIEVVDDYSMDVDIESLVKDVSGSRVGYFRQPENVGLVENWNTCINRAKGHYIHILHDDDIVLPGFYEALEEPLTKNHEIGAAFCRCIFIDHEGHWLSLSDIESRKAAILPNWLERIGVKSVIHFSSVVIRRSVYNNLGGFLPGLTFTPDWEMWRRIAVDYSFWFEPKPLGCCREHKGSVTSKNRRSGSNIADIRKSIEMCKSYFPDKLQYSVTRTAKKNYAILSISQALSMLANNDVLGAMNLFKEGLRCSTSPSVILFALKAIINIALDKSIKILCFPFKIMFKS